ncbi:hypothetical protein BDW69DRAFT_165483 [Aspergillus filifer]
MDGRGPYGLACKVCYKAKARCTRTENSAGCERCWRLGKDCVPSDSLRRRNMITYQSSQLENLEGRLDELTILIENMRTQQASSMMYPPFSTAFPPAQSLPAPEAILPSAPMEIPTPNEPTESPRPQEQPTAMEQDGGKWPIRQDEEVLKLFRSRFLPHTPFIYLPEDLTAEELKKKKPIIFHAIYVVTARLITEKVELGKEFKKMIAMKLVVENESNTELLTALLIYIAWSCDQHVNRDWTLSRLMELALSVVHALRLNAPEPLGAHRFTKLGGRHYWPAPKDADQRNPEFLEDQRAVLGCFLLTSFVSIFFTEIDPMPWTDLMEKYLENLDAHPQWLGDVALATHIRLQRVVQNCKIARQQQNGHFSIPIFVRTFQTQLEQVKKSMPRRLEDNDRILSHIHYAELMIRETAHSSDVPLRPREWGDQDPRPTLGADAVDCMWHALLAIRSWWSIFDRLSPDDFLGFSIVSWAQMGLCLVTLYRLSTHPAPDWDHATVRKTIDPLEVCQRIGVKVSKMMSDSDRKQGLDDFWGRSGSMAVGIQVFIRHGIERREAAKAQSDAAQEASTPSIATPAGSPETPGDVEREVARVETPLPHTEAPTSHTEAPTSHMEAPESHMEAAMPPSQATMAQPNAPMTHRDTPMSYPEATATPMASAWQQHPVIPHSYPYTMPDGSTGWMSNMGYPSEFVPGAM